MLIMLTLVSLGLLSKNQKREAEVSNHKILSLGVNSCIKPINCYTAKSWLVPMPEQFTTLKFISTPSLVYQGLYESSSGGGCVNESPTMYRVPLLLMMCVLN